MQLEAVETTHRIIQANSSNMREIADASVHLVVTSPPYPMIKMWDDLFFKQNENISLALSTQKTNLAFELMHKELEKTWSEVCRVVCEGGIVCVNIGDATRTINNQFALYSNHSHIINYFTSHGFVNLPNIIWRKQTNAPNKFMGSGMLPAGAYITLEHEWILIFRKSGKRLFKTAEEKLRRKKSAFFWEERNHWFSDIWDDIKGLRQDIQNKISRTRTAAFPMEIPYRLINMYSLSGDTVLDPFLGTGTTSIAAIISNRNSIGYEIDKHFADISVNNCVDLPVNIANNIIKNRIKKHKSFIKSYKRTAKHYCRNLGLNVMTSQETEINFMYLKDIRRNRDDISARYSNIADNVIPEQGDFDF